MTKEQQNLAWQCLPKEAREHAKRVYQYECTLKDYNDGANDTLESLFGNHNLTSDTEPSELLFVERKRIIAIYKDDNDRLFFNRETEAKRQQLIGEKNLLYTLFGDKCIPDFDILEQPSVQDKPKFKVGDKVRLRGYKSQYCIAQISAGKYNLMPIDQWFDWIDLEPYTKPETKDAYEQYQEAKAVEYNNQPKFNLEVTGDGRSDSGSDKEKELNRKALYDALCELETASAKVRKTLISIYK